MSLKGFFCGSAVCITITCFGFSLFLSFGRQETTNAVKFNF